MPYNLVAASRASSGMEQLCVVQVQDQQQNGQLVQQKLSQTRGSMATQHSKGRPGLRDGGGSHIELPPVFDYADAEDATQDPQVTLLASCCFACFSCKELVKSTQV